MSVPSNQGPQGPVPPIYGVQPSSGDYGIPHYDSSSLGFDGNPPHGQHESFSDFFGDFDINSESNLGWIFGDLPETYAGFIEPQGPTPSMFSHTLAENLRSSQENRQPMVEDMFSPLPTPIPQDRCHPNDPWPMEWHSTQAPRLILPKLGGEDVLARHFPTIRIDAALLTTFQESLRLPMERSPWQATLTVFPDEITLDHLIDMYFVHFQRVSTSPRLCFTWYLGAIACQIAEHA